MSRSMKWARRLCCVLACGLAAGNAGARSIDEDARAFGALPSVRSAELSPNGRFASFISMHSTDIPMLVVFDLEKGGTASPIASQPGVQDLTWCRWATDERLICGFHGVSEQQHVRLELTRLVAVDRDGSDVRHLVRQDRQYLDRVIDMLYDDPKRILVPYQDDSDSKRAGGAIGVAALDIHTTRINWVKRPRASLSGWMTDGHGELRVRVRDEPNAWVFEGRAVGSNQWNAFGTYSKTEFLGVSDEPEGFLEERNDLVVRRWVDGMAELWVIDLSGEAAPRLLFQHDQVDVGELLTIGRERRAVGVTYTTDRRRAAYFDARVLEMAARAQKTLPGMQIDVFSESWDRRYYLVSTQSDADPGALYRLDAENGHLLKLRAHQPELAGFELGRMRPFTYPARDGVEVPGYVTLPPGKPTKPLPTIVLPHGGPESRDEQRFDWLGQFLASRGYLVLQANYRGSGGYGLGWQGEGGYQGWALAMNDIEDGIANLVERGVADPDRICVLGGSYGGYAALMSVIVHPSRYRCAVSIAGVTDQAQLVEDASRFTNRRLQRDRVGTDAEVRRAGSPLKRVDEIGVPVLLFHGKNDVNVYAEHSERLAAAMKAAKKDVELVLYDDTEHSLDRSRARIDMLARIGRFLEAHLAKPAPPATPASD